MEAFLQARSRNAGAARAARLPAGIDRLVADLTTRIFGRRHCDDCAVAMDADRDQAHQRCAAGDGARRIGAADTGACRQMGHTPQRAHRVRCARNAGLFVGMYAALSAAYGLAPASITREWRTSYNDWFG